MAFGQDFLKGFFGSDNLRDYTHASKTFRSNGYEFAPRHKFLFHVSFTINTGQIPPLRAAFGEGDVSTLGMMVKQVQLPSYQVDMATVNQYNRKRLIQKGINYDPVQVTFHDDGSDLVRNMWYNYFSYYYKDPSQKYLESPNINGSLGQDANRAAGFDYNARDTYTNREVNDWGFIGESYSDGTSSVSGKPPFFRDIRIYGFNQHKFAEYVLINPLIENWRHDEYNYESNGEFMTNQMTIRYETVKYYTGFIGNSRPDTNVKGFADPAHYDTALSPLSRPGSRATVLGRGGLIDAGVGILNDLQNGGPAGVIGAIQKAGTVYNTVKGKNLKSVVKEEANQILRDVIRGSSPSSTRQVTNKVSGFSFPKAPF